MPRMKLLEVFTDFNIILEAGSQFGRYRQLMRIERRSNHPPITLERLQALVESLAKRYPERGFKLERSRLPDPAEKRRIERLIQTYKSRMLKSPIDTMMIQYYTNQLKNLPQKTLYRLSQSSRTPEGKKKRDYITILFDLENQKIFIPHSFLKRRRKLMFYLLMRTLGALGISQSKYMETIRRNKP